MLALLMEELVPLLTTAHAREGLISTFVPNTPHFVASAPGHGIFSSRFKKKV